MIIAHLLQIVDEDHVKGLVPAAVEEEVEAIHLQQVAVGALISTSCAKTIDFPAQ